MKRTLFLAILICAALLTNAQGRNLNKLTLESTYSYVSISKKLRDIIDEPSRESYFNDDYFNGMLKKIIEDKQLNAREKVQLFYLMQKKIGYAFVGINYIPPKQNYFIFYLSEVQVLQKTLETLQTLNVDPTPYLLMADSHQTKDPVIAANAILLATILNGQKCLPKLRKFTQSQVILQSKNPQIFNHYVSLSAALVQDSTLIANLKKNVFTFKQVGMIEDAFCSLYSRPHPLATIKEYILFENNPLNDLALQTSLCVLQTKVQEVSFKQNVKTMASLTKDGWKKDLLDKIAAGEIPYCYSLTSEEQLVPKSWDGVKISIYNDGALISNGALLEFDPN